MYESPIIRLTSEIQRQQESDLMLQLTQTVGYSIDKGELVKALRYDRQQYEKGYMDGLSTFSAEVAPELSALEAERDALRAELIEVLEKAASCREHDMRCGDCPYFHNSCGGCPSKLSADEAVRRLAVLRGD